MKGRKAENEEINDFLVKYPAILFIFMTEITQLLSVQIRG